MIMPLECSMHLLKHTHITCFYIMLGYIHNRFSVNVDSKFCESNACLISTDLFTINSEMDFNYIHAYSFSDEQVYDFI